MCKARWDNSVVSGYKNETEFNGIELIWIDLLDTKFSRLLPRRSQVLLGF